MYYEECMEQLQLDSELQRQLEENDENQGEEEEVKHEADSDDGQKETASP